MAPIDAESRESGQEYTRLHITPLNSDLLAAIVPPSILPAARNVSYHSLQSFPEKYFGFVDLPVMDAEKIKKKLNGTILRGTKVHIEEARPSKRSIVTKEEAMPSKKFRKENSEKPKKRKRDDETLPGVELHDRKVKRGWTDPTPPKKHERKSKDKTEKKESVKSKYTTGQECLFRTTIPANVVAAATTNAIPTAGTDGKRDKRKRGKAGKDTVIHEFSKTVKHATFLRQSGGQPVSKSVARYVEGKGWVDEEGNVVEAAVTKEKAQNPEVVQQAKGASITDSSSAAGSDDSEDETMLDKEELSGTTRLAEAPEEATLADDTTSSSGTSSSESEDEGSDSSSSSESEAKASPSDDLLTTPRPESSPAKSFGLSIEIPKNPMVVEAANPVHPLEALYKRRQPNSDAPTIAEGLPSFSFFDEDGDIEEGDEPADPIIPMTPFTKEDFSHRGVRSAAPTPDTAHPSRKYTRWPTDENENEYDEKVEDYANTPSQKRSTTSAPPVAEATDPVLDFEKWFYENRGETNRAWKKRRKLAAKEKRQSENRRRGDRAA